MKTLFEPVTQHIYDMIEAYEACDEYVTKVVVSPHTHSKLKREAADCMWSRQLYNIDSMPEVATVWGIPLEVGEAPATGVRMEVK